MFLYIKKDKLILRDIIHVLKILIWNGNQSDQALYKQNIIIIIIIIIKY